MPQVSVQLPLTRCRHTTSKAAPLTDAQQKERRARNIIRQEEINAAVVEWKKATLNTAANLARRFDKSDRYFLDLLFQGGVHLVHKQQKVNAHNAYLHMKAEELRDNGETPMLAKLHSSEFKTQYKELTHAEREELVLHHADSISDTHRQRPTAKARIQDVAHTFRTIEQLASVSVLNVFCQYYHMEPKWYFSNAALMDYMKIAVPLHKGWDIGHVGAKLEAFAIAGCDTINLNRTSKQRADEMKRQIREKITKMLTDITGNPNATMQYIGYEEKIVQRYGVALEGWTFDKFINPSELSTSLPGLRRLLDAINDGNCKFVKLTPLELKERRHKLQEAIDNGTTPPPKARKPRSDRGVKRKYTEGQDSGEGESKKLKPKKRKPISQELVISDVDG